MYCCLKVFISETVWEDVPLCLDYCCVWNNYVYLVKCYFADVIGRLHYYILFDYDISVFYSLYKLKKFYFTNCVSCYFFVSYIYYIQEIRYNEY